MADTADVDVPDPQGLDPLFVELLFAEVRSLRAEVVVLQEMLADLLTPA